ncbi:MAG: SpoVR family protein, partial [Candidatus Obscuribacterales bacterium]|nr:SpoVR family protein [Candidatus Obscuribacterales bacterium]
MENKNTTDMHDEIEIMARRSESAIKRILEPHIMRLTGKPLRKVKYVVTSNNNLVQTLPYVGMPRFMRHWSHGKQAQHWLDQTSSHFFELVLNDDPCTCYLSVNNRLPMQGLVIAHAIGGHMVFFQLNRLFEDTMPETVVKRFAQQDEKTNALISDAKFGIRKVERIVDAARAVQQHVPRVPQPKILATEGPDAGQYIPQPVATEKEVKERLHDELAELEHLIATKGASSNFWFDHYTEKKHQVVEALRRHPFEPTYDLLGFVLDPVNSPHLSDKERMLVNFVRDQSLYFQPQGRTKRMNEGFASFMEKYILQQPEVSLSFDLEFDLAHYWTMHLKNPLGKYYDPYTLGL